MDKNRKKTRPEYSDLQMAFYIRQTSIIQEIPKTDKHFQWSRRLQN